MLSQLLIVDALKNPPVATLLIAGLAILVNILTSLVRKRFTNIERSRRTQKEVKEFNSDLRNAIMSKDKAKEEKLRKKQKSINEMQMKMFSENMRASIIFMLPFFAVWSILTGYFGYEVIMAYSPLDLPLLGGSGIIFSKELNFFWWYFLSSMTFNGVLSKILGTGMTI